MSIKQEFEKFEDLLLREIESLNRDSEHEMVILWGESKFPITVTEALPIRLWKYRKLLNGKKYTINVNGHKMEYYEYNRG